MLVFDYHSSYHHPNIYTKPAGIRVQVLGIDAGQIIPGNKLGQFYPTVIGIQLLLKRMFEIFQTQLT